MEIGHFGLAVFQQGTGKVLTERSLLLSYARSLSRNTSLGMNAKYLSIDPGGRQITPNDPALVNQDTVSFDLSGLISVTPFWKLGVLTRNIGGELGAAVREPLRRTYRVGSSYRFEDVMFMDDAIIWALDLFTKDDIKDTPGVRIQASTGVEYSFDERVSIRLGFDRGNFAAGLGFGHPEAGIFVDYAMSNDEIGTTHRISATYRFGAPPGEIAVVHHRPDGRRHRSHESEEGDRQPAPRKTEDGAPAEQERPPAKSSSRSVRPTDGALRKAARPTNRGVVDPGLAGRTGGSTIGVSTINRSEGGFDREIRDFMGK
jgi:hypothetical protein